MKGRCFLELLALSARGRRQQSANGPGRGASRLELGPFSSGFVPSGWFRELNTE